MAKVGRPTKYKEEYCEKLMEHMKQGFSFESFGAIIGVHRDTLYEWELHHSEFSDSKKKGVELSRLFWEKMGMEGAQGKIQGFRDVSFIFQFKNRFDKKEDKEKKVFKLVYDPDATNEE